MVKTISVEQINVSDDTYKLHEICCESGKKVNKGDHLLSYESSKSVFEYEASDVGYFYLNPNIKLDEFYETGFLLGIIADKKMGEDDLKQVFAKDEASNDGLDDKVKITKKARELIKKNGIELSDLGKLKIITEKNVKDFINKNDKSYTNLNTFQSTSIEVTGNDQRKRLGVLGAGKAALQLADAAYSSDEWIINGFYETNESYSLKKLLNINVNKICDVNDIAKDFKNNLFDFFIISFSGDIHARKNTFSQLIKLNIPFANVFHKDSIISKTAKIGTGNIIFANARIGPYCKLGDNNVISAGCSIEHNNELGNNNTFGPGVMYSGSCITGDNNKFGTMVGIEPNVNIGSNNIISSGLIVNRNINDNQLVRNLSKIEILNKE